MSAFVVENKTINRIISFLHKWKDNYWIEEKIKEEGFDIATESGRDAFGRALLLMNINAVNQRYNEKDDGKDDGTNILKEYRFKFELVDIVQALKSAQCLRYQCSSSCDVLETSLYKLLDRIISVLAEAIVRSMEKYRMAEWG